MIKYLLLGLLLAPSLAFAQPYEVVKDQSVIGFSGTHAGKEFKGEFEDYTAEIDYDTDKPDSTSAIINLDVRGAKTGNAMYDGTLPSADWFDAGQYPQAVFELTSMEKITETTFKATGDLTIRDVTKPISFEFTLQGNSPLIMTADIPVNRLDYNIGTASDEKAEWVSKIIMIHIKLAVMPRKDV